MPTRHPFILRLSLVAQLAMGSFVVHAPLVHSENISNAAQDPGAVGFDITAYGDRTASWHSCVDFAEKKRSERDSEFFRTAGSLSSAKHWFVKHSINNEMRFCQEISNCKKLFDQEYPTRFSSYPPC